MEMLTEFTQLHSAMSRSGHEQFVVVDSAAAEGARAKLHGTIAAALPSPRFLDAIRGVLELTVFAKCEGSSIIHLRTTRRTAYML